MNLGWKLAQVVKRLSPTDLRDTYHSERHPVAARVLRNTMAHVALRRRDDRSRALSDYVFQFLSMDQPRRRIVGEVSGLDVHYDLGDRHPLLGRRMPDIDLATSNRATRVFTLLRGGQPVLVNFSERTIELRGWADRVRVIDAKCLGNWQLPVLGAVTAQARC